MPRARLVMVVLLLFTGLRVAHCRETADDAARREWMAGYVKLEEAGRAEKDRNFPLALQLYRKAHAAFQRVRARYPDWNPALIDYRINYCAARIKRLEGLVAANRNQMTRTELLELCDQYAARIRKLQQENLRLSRKLEITSQALDRARTEAARSAKAASMVPDLLKQHDLLEKRLAEATAKVATMQKNLADLERLRKAAERAERAARERDEAQTQLKEATARLEALAADSVRIRKALAALRQQKQDAEDLAAEQKRNIERLRKQLATVRKELADVQEALDRQVDSGAKLERKYARARARAEAAEKEILRLKAQVDDLQEWQARWQDEHEKRTQIEKDLNDLQVRIDALEKANADIDSRRDEWRKRALAAEAALKAANVRIADLERRASAPAPTTAPPAAGPEDGGTGQEGESGTLVLDWTLDALSEAWGNALDAAVARDVALAEIRSRDADLQALRKERDDLTRSLKELHDRLKQAESAAAATATLTAEIKQLRDTLATETDRRRKAEAAVAALQTVLDDRRKRLDDYRARIEELSKKTDQQEKTIDRLRRQLNERAEGADSWRKQERALQAALLQARKDLAAEQVRRKELEQALAAQKELGKTQEQALRRLASEKQDLETVAANLKRDLAAARQRIRVLEDGSAVVEGLKSSLEKTDADLEDARKKLAESREETARLRAALDAERTRRATAEEEVRRLRAAFASVRSSSGETEALRRQIRSLSDQLGKARDRIAALEKTLAETGDSRTVRTAVPRGAGGTAISEEQRRRLRDRRMLVRGFLRQGIQAEQAGRKEAAVWNYRKVLEYDPDNATALVRLGLLAAEGGDDDAAVGYLSKAFYKNPDDVDILIPLGYALVRRRDVDLAVSMLARAAALRPEDPAVHRALGVAYSALGWPDAAEAELRRALKLAPNDAQSAFNLAVLLASRGPGRLAEAKKWYARAKKNGAEPDPGLDALFRE